MALRWRKDPKERGLARIVAGRPGSGLYDGLQLYAKVYAAHGNISTPPAPFV